MTGPSPDRRIGWFLFGGGFLSLLLSERAAGFVRDESQYFGAGESYARWWKLALTAPSQAFTERAINGAFDVNHEHPALMKTLFGISMLIFNETLGLLRPAAAFRVPAFLVAAMVLPLIYAMARPLVGRIAAAFAAISFLLVPRQFFEAHLSCFDVPVAAMWLLVIYCYAKSQGAIPVEEVPPTADRWKRLRGQWWLWTGLSFGAAIATKHNAFFLPFVVIPFSLWRGWKASADVA